MRARTGVGAVAANLSCDLGRLASGTLLLLSVLNAGAARAYCANPNVTVAEEVNESAGVFVGRVVAARETAELCPDPGWTYSLDVKKVFRGSLGKRVEVSTENNSGRYLLQVGHEYLLFAKAGCRPPMIFGGCGHSAPTGQAGSTLRALEALVESRVSREPANPRLQRPAAASGRDRR